MNKKGLIESTLIELDKKYEEARKKECEELQNGLVNIIIEQNASIQNSLMVLELIRFQLLEAKYREVMGVVKLTDKPPLAMVKSKEK